VGAGPGREAETELAEGVATEVGAEFGTAQLAPPSADQATSRTPWPPSKAMPLTASGAPAGTRAPSCNEVMKLRTFMRPIGRVAAGVVPGSMQAQSLSGMR
jgi:hypothetical protein